MTPLETLRIYKRLTLTGANARLGLALEIRKEAKATGLRVSYRSYFVGMRRVFVLETV
jgi:hypothetical protein